MRHIVAVLFLAGCATAVPPEPVVRTVTVDRPVTISCVPKDTPSQPAYPDTDAALKAATNEEDALNLVVAGRPLRKAWGDLAAKVIDKCR